MAGEGIVFAQDFPKFLAKELIKRQEILRRTNMGINITDSDIFKNVDSYNKYKQEDLEFLLGKMSFIRMTSNAIPKKWPPTKLDVLGNEYIVPNWNNNESTDGAEKYSWRPEDDTRTITKYDIRKDTVLMGGNLIFKKGANGNDNFMMPRSGFDEVYGTRSYGVVKNFLLGEGTTLDEQIQNAEYEKSGVNTTTNMTYRPMPGINSISVSLSSQFIRKATIKWQCYDWDDFDIYERLYLTPGLSVFLEWGWTTVDRILPILDFSYNYHKPREYFSKLMNKIMSSNGKYDAMVGVISNFNWSATGHVIDCTTEIMSPASLLSQSSIINPEMKRSKGQKDTLKDLFKKLESINTDEPYNINNDVDGVVNVNSDNTTIQIYEYEWGHTGNKSKDSSGRYISWNDFEKILTAYVAPAAVSENIVKDVNQSNETTLTDEQNKENPIIPILNENKDDGNLFKIHSADFAIDNTKSENVSISDLLYWSNYKTIGNNMFLCSCDPKVCLLPGQVFLTNSVFSKNDLSDIPTLKSKNEPKTFYSPDSIINSNIKNDRSIGILNNMLINISFIKEQLNGVENVKALLTNKIYNGIQDACGNMYQFQFIQSVYDPFIMQTHDAMHSSTQATAMLFNARSNDSIVKSISVNGEIPGTLASALWIRANATDEIDTTGDKTIFSRDGYVDGFLSQINNSVKKPTKEVWNKLNDKQKQQLAKKFNMSTDEFTKLYDSKTTKEKDEKSDKKDVNDNTKQKNTDTTKDDKKEKKGDNTEVTESTEEDEDKNLPLERVFENKIIRFYQALRFVYKNYSKDYVDTARARLVQLLYMTQKLMESNTFDNRLLPIKLNITIDGISGILFNQAITTNLLPQRYFANALFRITEINNDVSSGGWTTNIGAIMSITPINYRIWMKTNNDSDEIQPVKVKYYDKFYTILDKLNFNRIRTGVMSDKIKLVKLKSDNKEENKNEKNETKTNKTTTTSTKTNESYDQGKDTGKTEDGVALYNTLKSITAKVDNEKGTVEITINSYAAASVNIYLYQDKKAITTISSDMFITSDGTKTFTWTDLSNYDSGNYEIHARGLPNIKDTFTSNNKKAKYQVNSVFTKISFKNPYSSNTIKG